MKKWIQGILVSVIAGLVVWFLTKSPYSPWVGPKVELADVDVPRQITAGEEFAVTFRATNQNNRAQPGCDGFVEISPSEENGAGNGRLDVDPQMSGSEERRPNIDASEVIQIHRLPPKPVVPDAITVPAQPLLLARRHAVCHTINPEFTLRGVSGSAVQVLVDCVVHRPGVFQITYGIHCKKDEDSLWRLDHRGYIKVGRP